MRLTYKYRIYPNEEQQKELFSIFKFCRFLYNSALEERINFYKIYKKSKNYYDQTGSLFEIKKEFSDETKNIYSQTLQQVLKQLQAAYDNFFRRVKNKEVKPGFPRFKNQDRFRSICFPQVSDDLSKGCVKLINNKIKIYGITSPIKIKYHRKFEGIAKQCRIFVKNDEFYLFITCDKVPKKVLGKMNKTVGIDLGIVNFVTLDDGIKFQHPKPYKTSKEKLAYQQRKLAFKKSGSNNRKKQKKLVAKTHQKIVNIRDDFQHKLANHLIKIYDKIVVEDLNIKKMLESKGYEVNNVNIQEASWGTFIQKLIYKAESADKLIIKVNPANTSKMCSNCGHIKKNLLLQDRIYNCEACGFAIDRDINAAINIKKLGISFAININNDINLRSPAL